MHAFDRRTDRQTGRQTDRQTDGQTEFPSLYRDCIPCSAVKIAYFPFLEVKKRLETLSDCQIIALLYEIWVAEFNGYIRSLTGS